MADFRVSVIVSTYNYSTVLPYSIASALRQSIPPSEVVVVGDHCTDDTADVVAAIGDDRVRFVNLPERTMVQSGPNNEGLAQAKGDVIAYLGHDDLWLPDHVAHLEPALQSGAEVAYEMTILPSRSHATTVWPTQPYWPGMWIPPTVAAHWRTASDLVGGWRLLDQLRTDPDADLWARMHEAGVRMDFVPRIGAVKFPAALRRGVYLDRPSDEQAMWASRMAHEPDLEAVEGIPALLDASSLSAIAAKTPGGELVPAVARELARRARRRLTSQVLRKVRDRDGDFRRRYEERLRFKGLL